MSPPESALSARFESCLHFLPSIFASLRSIPTPHREQVVSHRESLATMLQALELTNGSALDEQLQQGADHWLREAGSNTNRLVSSISLSALGRESTSREQALAAELLGTSPTKDGVADFLWTMILLPEFQLVP